MRLRYRNTGVFQLANGVQLRTVEVMTEDLTVCIPHDQASVTLQIEFRGILHEVRIPMGLPLSPNKESRHE